MTFAAVGCSAVYCTDMLLCAVLLWAACYWLPQGTCPSPCATHAVLVHYVPCCSACWPGALPTALRAPHSSAAWQYCSSWPAHLNSLWTLQQRHLQSSNACRQLVAKPTTACGETHRSPPAACRRQQEAEAQEGAAGRGGSRGSAAAARGAGGCAVRGCSCYKVWACTTLDSPPLMDLQSILHPRQAVWAASKQQGV